MTTALKSLVALLGLWLVVAVSVFPADAALWIAFGTSVAIATAAGFLTALTAVRSRRVSSALVTAGLASFLIVASLVFEGASLGWLMAISGASIVGFSLATISLPQLRLTSAAPVAVEPVAEAAAPRLAA